MKLVALLLARNEEWCVGFTLRCLLKFADAVVVMEHRCIDRTHEIVCECAAEVEAGRVIVAADDHHDWQEMRLRQEMLKIARQHGATHIWLGDADEVLTANLVDGIRQTVSIVPVGRIMVLPLYNLRGGIDKYHADGIWGNRITSVAFVDDARLGWFGDRFHSREPQGTPTKLGLWPPPSHGAGGVMHLWGADERRLIAKHRKYRIDEAMRWPNKSRAEIERMYSWSTDGDPITPSYGTPATWKYSPAPNAWWAGHEHILHQLRLEEIPWQEAWCDEMIERHGIHRFEGLRVRASDFPQISR